MGMQGTWLCLGYGLQAAQHSEARVSGPQSGTKIHTQEFQGACRARGAALAMGYIAIVGMHSHCRQL
eukprot:scaffold93288_cov19-Tisochrysis_lutea.AAC.3